MGMFRAFVLTADAEARAFPVTIPHRLFTALKAFVGQVLLAEWASFIFAGAAVFFECTHQRMCSG